MLAGVLLSALLAPLLWCPAPQDQAQCDAAAAEARIKALVAELDGADRAAQDQAAAALRDLPAAQLGPLLAPLLDSKQARTRRVTLKLMRDKGCTQAGGRITTLLHSDQDAAVRREASHALLILHPERAVSALADVAELDHEASVRRAAILDLGSLRNRAALDALVDILAGQIEKGDDYLAGITARALTLCTGKTLGTNVEGWRHFASTFQEETETEEPPADEPEEDAPERPEDE
ncbi:MAG: HEAT repeat domain-containing protein [Planctomycetes bacterium]|nr:HEAT repeat domain-containing protein [Planctomycetota bacterium]